MMRTRKEKARKEYVGLEGEALDEGRMGPKVLKELVRIEIRDFLSPYHSQTNRAEKNK